jgi:hypothetical protein
MKTLIIIFTFGVISFFLINFSDKENDHTKPVNKCKESFALSVYQKLVIYGRNNRLKKEVDEFNKLYNDQRIDCDDLKEFYESKIETVISFLNRQREDSLYNIQKFQQQRFYDSVNYIQDSIKKQSDKILKEILNEIDELTPIGAN